jgi:hypothetical protein
MNPPWLHVKPHKAEPRPEGSATTNAGASSTVVSPVAAQAQLLVSQSHDRVHFRRAAGWNVAGQNGNRG